MKQRQQMSKTFIFFFFISLITVFFFRTQIGASVQGIIELIYIPFQKITYAATSDKVIKNESQEVTKLKEENRRLQLQLSNIKNIEREAQALRDQFNTSNEMARKLLPVAILGIGDALFVKKQPTTIIIDKGNAEGVHTNDVVVYKNIILGKVAKASEHVSVVETVYNKRSTFSGQAVQSGAVGVVRAQGDGILFDNVILSEKLEVNDVIQTKGDVNEQGRGYTPGLLVGKITAVHKKASALFQSAEITPMIDMTRLTIAFVLVTQ
jgi:rod shape-determining protein MreC